MDFGVNNSKANYEMIGKYLEEVIEGRDLGVILQNDLMCCKQFLKAVNTAHEVLGIIV